MTSLSRKLSHCAGLSLGLSLVMGLVFGRGDDGFDLAHVAVNTGVGLLYSLSIGLPATAIFGKLKPRIHRPILRQWLVYAGVMTAVILVGTLFSGVVLVVAGLVEPAELWVVYRRGLVVSGVISIPMTIGVITVSRLYERLGTVEAERQRALALATEARLASLESRVRPHFLFNALNSAIALIPDEPRRAEDVLERLCALLRFSLDTQMKLVPLGVELRVVTDYLEIERVRFGDRLGYTLDVPAELHALEVPAFAVQTLVENSVKYAVSARKQGAHIHVIARQEAGRLALDIRDDGPGFTGEIWVPGHGLDGLRARLDALYGARAKLVAPAAAATGAAVRIEIQEAA
ncbi:MAG: histidine kinase [Kofleriaceae bacterium]